MNLLSMQSLLWFGGGLAAGYLGYAWLYPAKAQAQQQAQQQALPAAQQQGDSGFELIGDEGLGPVDQFGQPISLDEPQAANGWVGSPSFGTGVGARPDFAMGYQPWQTGGTFAPISGGSIGY